MTKKQKTKKDSGEKDYLISYLYVNELAKDEIKRLREEVIRLIKLTEWQPIETAPKDGRNILVYDGYIMIGFFDGNHWLALFDESKNPELNPTHWMPLPNQPKQ